MQVIVKGKTGSSWATSLPNTPELFKISWSSGLDSYGAYSVYPLGVGDVPDGVLVNKVNPGPRLGNVTFMAVDVVVDEAVAPGDYLVAKASGGGRMVKGLLATAEAIALTPAAAAGDLVKAAWL